MNSPKRNNLKRKAIELQSLHSSGQKTVWEVKMIDGKDTICTYAKTCQEAASQCITTLCDRISDKRDQTQLISSSLDILKSPEQDEDTWRQFAIKNKVLDERIRRLLGAVNTCSIRRCVEQAPREICFDFPPDEEESLPPLNLDWSCREPPVDMVTPDWDRINEFADATPVEDVQLVDPNWGCAKEFAHELYGPLPNDSNEASSTVAIV